MFILSSIAVSLSLFLAGASITGQLSHIVGPRRRLWLFLCNFVQASMVLAAALIQFRKGVDLEGPITLVVLALLAFASGSQVVQSRSLSVMEITTAMATAAWVDLLMDRRIFKKSNRPRSRRAAFLLTLLLGALFGALMYRHVGSAAALTISAGGKFVVAGMVLFHGPEPVKEEKLVEKA
jgi:uncharacterized membrane protein YoaK (UPF0700 family)